MFEYLTTIGLGQDLDRKVLISIFELFDDDHSGAIDKEEMFTVFNMGVGLIVVAPSNEVEKIIETIQGQGMAGWVMGEIAPCSSSDNKLTYST